MEWARAEACSSSRPTMTWSTRLMPPPPRMQPELSGRGSGDRGVSFSAELFFIANCALREHLDLFSNL